jgi:uncharacterized 2Fe-2S/4Fe-4S cluster protein (DUF4445 family)
MRIQLEINQQFLEVEAGKTLFDLADAAGIRVPTTCQRQGKCRECLMEVVEGMELLSPLAEQEEHLRPPFRLSCRTRIEGTSGMIRCHTLRRGDVKITDEGCHLPVSGKPMELDPAVTRDGDRILLDGEEIARSTGPIYGLAVDLGTTTVSVRLVDLASGHLVATESFENPQRFGGSDVMARIQYDTERKGRLLQRVLLGYLGHAIEALPVNALDIYELVIAGNATMRDIFFGLDVYTIGQKPYKSITELEMLEGKRASTHLEKPARQLRLPIHPKARVYGLPLVGGHVGADTAACLLAIELDREDRMVALMDIGTNTELIVGNRSTIFAASCPAGPAFEGGELSCGMPGVDGAIERARLDGDAIELEVIGDIAPQGLCGSGLIDLLSELLRTRRMNSLGRLAKGEGRFAVSEAEDVYLLENDISLLAQAKGANVAGLQIVFERYGLSYGDIDVFYFAGGFARHIEVAAAKRIGLIPNLPDATVVQVGNASLEGATIALCSTRRREALHALVQGIEHVQLESHPDFFDHFVYGCQFVPVESGGLQ